MEKQAKIYRIPTDNFIVSGLFDLKYPSFAISVILILLNYLQLHLLTWMNTSLILRIGNNFSSSVFNKAFSYLLIILNKDSSVLSQEYIWYLIIFFILIVLMAVVLSICLLRIKGRKNIPNVIKHSLTILIEDFYT